MAAIPTLAAFGPGQLPLAHGPNEWVSINSLRQAMRMYALTALEYGVEMNAAFLAAAKKAGIEVVFTKSYPFGSSDLQPVLRAYFDPAQVVSRAAYAAAASRLLGVYGP